VPIARKMYRVIGSRAGRRVDESRRRFIRPCRADQGAVRKEDDRQGQIAQALGISFSTANRWRYEKLGLPAHEWFPDEHWGPDAKDKMREGAEHTLKVRKPRSVKPVRSGIQAPNGRGFA
jgi:hypothetical protein